MLALSCDKQPPDDGGGAVGVAVAALSVATCAQLQAISSDLAGSYVLAGDIDCTGFDAGDGAGFEPLGNRDEVPFSGTFDGDGHVITGLTIARPWGVSVGLFGGTDGAVIERVGVINASVEGSRGVGILVGFAVNTTVREAYATGVVTGWTDTGGLVGELTADSSLEDSYAAVNAIAEHDHGLLVGWIDGSIEASYAYGSAPARLGRVSDGAIEASFYDCDIAGDCAEPGATDTAAMGTQSLYTDAGWDFDDTWGFLAPNSYPCLRWQDGCGCLAGHDDDGDGVPDCSDDCVADANKTAPGVCGCGKPDVDTDGDGPLDCNDPCPQDPTKVEQGVCGCNEPDVDADGDGLLNCNDPDWPRAIRDCAELQAMRDDLAGSYRLVLDIDCTGFDAGDGAGFEPIGHRDEVPFSGTFDGNGHEIRGLTVARPWQVSAGLFGGTDGAVIERVGVIDANVEGSWGVGALIGFAVNTTLRESFATGVVAGWTDTGGLVGELVSGSTIEDCYASVIANADNDNGLLVGWIDGSIHRSYASAATPPTLGRLSEGAVFSTFYDCDLAADCSQPGASSTAAMSSQGTFTNAGWDFDTRWGFLGPNGYPCLRWQDGCGCVADRDSDGDGVMDCDDGCVADAEKTAPGECGCGHADVDGDGDGPLNCDELCPFDATKIEPGLCGCNEPDVDADGDGLLNCDDPDWPQAIRDCAELQAMRDDIAGNYRLVLDIDCTSFEMGDGGGFYPIGEFGAPFTGSFDGNGHIVRGLTINRPSEHKMALFGFTEGAEIERVGLVDVDIGGLDYVAALVGWALDTRIRASFATGVVEGNHGVGGLVGDLDTHSTISDSYAAVAVTGAEEYGLLVGFVAGVVERSYASGVSDPGSLGTLCDWCGNASLEGCFFDCSVAGNCAASGGTSTALMTTPSTFEGVSWDLETVWSFFGESSYPCLRWQAGCGDESCGPNDATCNQQDDDCDGNIDDDFVAQSTSCGTGACARTGTTMCVAGSVQNSCVPGAPSADTDCDAIDDDCDGASDDNFASQSTSCGTGACARTGTTSCVAGSVQNSCVPGTPSADTDCDAIDDDCDGVNDDGFVGQATSCGTGVCARTGTSSCTAGSLGDTCVPGSPTGNDSTCNGVNEDCDAQLDEAYGGTSTSCTVGGCAASGVLTCVSGSVQDSCLTNPTCVAEVNCGDSSDNDSDGATDCTDSDCANVPPCGFQPEVCGNTVDDDGNGLFDCADTACAVSPLCSDPPPRAEDVAPTLSNTTVASLHDATAFVYAGPSPVQYFMEPETIVPDRTALLRGSVRDRTDHPLPTVRVTVLDHPEYGESRTDVDGMFSMVVNGGGALTVRFELPGYLPVDRTVTPVWNDTAVVDDAVLSPLDPVVTPVTLDGTSGPQVVRGSVVTDEDGSRQATLILPASIGAQMVMPDGSVEPLPAGDLRATEYTVGAQGLEAMAAALPPTTSYTYMVELSVDQALEAGASTVQFSEPIALYVDNFIEAPIGTGVPQGYYDRLKGVWVADRNGRVVSVLSEAGGRAVLDVTGTGVAATAAQLADLGVTDAELVRVANVYEPGASLWRVPIDHFTPRDCNWPWGPPPDARMPPSSNSDGGQVGGERKTRQSGQQSKGQNDTRCPGSQIGCFNQTLGEDIPIHGTPYKLHYESSRYDYTSQTLSIDLSDDDLPDSLKDIELKVEVAGRKFEQRRPAEENQSYTFEFDGRDAFGRKLSGTQEVLWTLCYHYNYVAYADPAEQEQSFALVWGSGGASAAGFTTPRFFGYYPFCQSWKSNIYLGIAGDMADWELNVHHTLDPQSGMVLQGDGGKHSMQPFGVPSYTNLGPGGPCTNALECGFAEAEKYVGSSLPIFWPDVFAVAPDGTMFIAITTGFSGASDEFDYIIRLRPNGFASRIIGTPKQISFSPVPPPTLPGTQFIFYVRPSNFNFNYPGEIVDMEVGPDGKLYVLVYHPGNTIFPSFNYVARFNQDGSDPEIVAGDKRANSPYPEADGLPATQVNIRGSYTRALTFGPDGSMYIVQPNRVLRIGTDGIFSTFAGRATLNLNGKPELVPIDLYGRGDAIRMRALGFEFGQSLSDIAFNDAGEAIVAANRAGVMVIGTDGYLRLLAGGSSWAPPDPDPYEAIPGPSNFNPFRVVIGPLGEVYAMQGGVFANVYRISNGALVSVAGLGYGTFAEGMPSTAVMNNVTHMIKHPDGNLLLGDRGRYKITTLDLNGSLPKGAVNGRGLVPAPDGRHFWEFVEGKHTRTLLAETGATALSFGYGQDGKLSSVTDGNGNVTAFDRNSSGYLTAIRPPLAPQTTITTDPGGKLQTVTGPDGGRYTLAYGPEGLSGFTTPRSFTSTFGYGDDGRLTSDTDPTGGVQALSRTEDANSFEVQRSVTGIANPFKYREALQLDGSFTREVEGPDGAVVSTSATAGGWITTIQPDGTRVEVRQQADPMFGMSDPIPYEVRTTLPSNVTRLDTETRTITYANSTDPFAINTRETHRRIGSRGPFVTTSNGLNRTYTSVSPMGRQVVRTVDAQGRLVRVEAPGLHPIAITYDATGRVSTTSVATGSEARARTFTYDPSTGFLQTATGPSSGETRSFVRDAAGRASVITRTDGEQILLGHDASGNLTSVTPPDQAAFGMTYTPLDFRDVVTVPPALPAGQSTIIDNDYTQARRVDRYTMSGGRTVDLQYAPDTGRLTNIITGTASLAFGYHPTTRAMNGVTSVDAAGTHTFSTTYDGSLFESGTWGGPTPGLVQGSVRAVKDGDFLLDRLQVNGMEIADYGYDADGLLITANGLTVARNSSNGIITGTTLGSVASTQAITAFGELQTATTTWSGATYYAENVTERDKAGRIRQRTETQYGGEEPVVHQHAYEYDAFGRLTRVLIDGAQTSHYTWDANGNRTSHETPAGTIIGRYDGAGRLTRYCPEDVAGSPSPIAGLPCVSQTYLPSGELSERTDLTTGGVSAYRYDELGALRRVVLADGRTIDYEIDPTGRRVGKRLNGTKQWGLLYLDPLRPIAQLDASNNVVSTFVYATQMNVPDLMMRSGRVYRIVTDHLGSVRLIVDSANGTVAQRLDYDEFGQVITDTNPGFQPFGFAGGLYDPDTGLVRFGLRDYDAVSGRWTAADPMLFRGLDTNLYAYVYGDPINRIDPVGDIPTVVIGAAIGAVFGGFTAWTQGQDVVAGAVGGAISGALAGTGAGLVAAAAAEGGLMLAVGSISAASSSALGEMFGQMVQQSIDPNPAPGHYRNQSCQPGYVFAPDWGGIAAAGIAGGLTFGMGAHLGRYAKAIGPAAEVAAEAASGWTSETIELGFNAAFQYGAR